MLKRNSIDFPGILGRPKFPWPPLGSPGPPWVSLGPWPGTPALPWPCHWPVILHSRSAKLRARIRESCMSVAIVGPIHGTQVWADSVGPRAGSQPLLKRPICHIGSRRSARQIPPRHRRNGTATAWGGAHHSRAVAASRRRRTGRHTMPPWRGSWRPARHRRKKRTPKNARHEGPPRPRVPPRTGRTVRVN